MKRQVADNQGGSPAQRAAVLTPETAALITLRLEQAAESLAEARLLTERGMRLGAMQAVYYTMFFCASALLATREFRPTAAGGVAGKFAREFVRTGLLPAEIGEQFARATQIHHDMDFGDQQAPAAARLQELLAEAESFLTTTKLFLAR
jgi:uncharacterized protein (UPF0332 family)